MPGFSKGNGWFVLVFELYHKADLSILTSQVGPNSERLLSLAQLAAKLDWSACSTVALDVNRQLTDKLILVFFEHHELVFVGRDVLDAFAIGFVCVTQAEIVAAYVEYLRREIKPVFGLSVQLQATHKGTCNRLEGKIINKTAKVRIVRVLHFGFVLNVFLDILFDEQLKLYATVVLDLKQQAEYNFSSAE